MYLINLKYYDDKTEVYRKKRDELYRQAMQEIQLAKKLQTILKIMSWMEELIIPDVFLASQGFPDLK